MLIRLLVVLLFTTSVQANEKQYANLTQFVWRHGSESCAEDQNPPIEIVQAASSSYVLRQNKCITFEAPFIYLLFGQKTALVVDTGANELASDSPIFKTVKSLFDQKKQTVSPRLDKILVVHSHSHSDHTQGDVQFVGKDNVEIVKASSKALENQLSLKNWPNLSSTIDLGSRKLEVIPIPGHQEHSIAIYDQQTKWLLTGDTLYPGVIRVKNWSEFRNSIERLFEFSKQNPVSHVLGAHIEMNRATNKPYRIGETYQPEETPLALNASHLELLHSSLQASNKAKKIKFDSFVVSPLSFMEKLLIKALSKKPEVE